jgi:hypothetical protein
MHEEGNGSKGVDMFDGRISPVESYWSVLRRSQYIRPVLTQAVLLLDTGSEGVLCVCTRSRWVAEIERTPVAQPDVSMAAAALREHPPMILPGLSWLVWSCIRPTNLS